MLERLTRKASAAAVAAALLAGQASAALAATEDGGFSVRGLGASTCGDLTARLAEENAEAVLAMLGNWVAGYLTHANRTSPGIYDAMPVVDNMVVARMGVNVCQANPESMVETAFANLIHSFQHGAATRASPLVELSHEDHATAVRQDVLVKVQQALIEAGHLPAGSADGAYGPATREALASFQAGRGIAQTGIPDPVTLVNLFIPEAGP